MSPLNAADAGATVVIVGAGVAGATAAFTLRTEGFGGRVVLIGAEAEEPYRRPTLSKDVLAGTTEIARARLKPAGFWAERDIELRLGTPVSGIDPDRRTVTLADGETFGYDALLLATGGRPRLLPDTAGDRVHHLREHADVPALRDRLTEGSSLLVVGGGLIGSEVASTARGLDCRVTVLEAQPRPMARILPPQIAASIEALHASAGVDLLTGVELSGLAATAEGVQARAADGRSWQGDAAVVAIGMVPNTDLADVIGAAVDDGIVVDESFRTTVDGVYAAGDVANIPNAVLGGRYRGEHWNGAQDHGAAAAKAILGGSDGYDAVPWAWSNQFGKNIQVVGWPSADNEVDVRGSLDEHDFTAVCRREGRVVGGVTMGRPKDTRALRTLISQGADVPAGRLA